MSYEIDDDFAPGTDSLGTCMFHIINHFYLQFIDTTQENQSTKKDVKDYTSGFRLNVLPKIYNYDNDIRRQNYLFNRFFNEVIRISVYDSLKNSPFFFEAIRIMWDGKARGKDYKYLTRDRQRNAIKCLLFVAAEYEDTKTVTFIISLPDFPINNANNNYHVSILNYVLSHNYTYDKIVHRTSYNERVEKLIINIKEFEKKVLTKKQEHSSKKKELVEILLKHPKININKIVTSKFRNGTPLMLAKMYAEPEIYNLLLQHPSLNINKMCRMDCHAYSRTMLGILIRQSEHIEYPSRKVTIDYPNLDEIKALLSRDDIDVNLATSNHSSLCYAILCQNVDLVKLLLEHKNIDVNRGERSPLYLAISYNDINIVKLLLEHKNIDVNQGRIIEGGSHISPLMHAINLCRYECINLLLTMSGLNIFKKIKEYRHLHCTSFDRTDYGNEDYEEDSEYYGNRGALGLFPVVETLENIYCEEMRITPIDIFDLLICRDKTAEWFSSKPMIKFIELIRKEESAFEDILREEKSVLERQYKELDLDADSIVTMRESWKEEKERRRENFKLEQRKRNEVSRKNISVQANEDYLHYEKERVRITKFLIERFGEKAKILAKSKCLYNSITQDKILELFGELTEIPLPEEEKEEAIEEVIEPLIQEELKPIKNLTPNQRRHENKKFVEACKNDTSDMIKKYLDRGCNVNYLSSTRSTPLMAAIKEGNLRALPVLLEHPNMKLNKRDKDGRTALDYLIYYDNYGTQLLNNYVNGDTSTPNYIKYGPLKYMPHFLEHATIDQLQRLYERSEIPRTQKMIHDVLRKKVSRTITEIDLFGLNTKLEKLPQLPEDVYKYIIARMLVPITTWWPKFSRIRENEVAIEFTPKISNKRPSWQMMCDIEKMVDDESVLEPYPQRGVVEDDVLVRRRRVVEIDEDDEDVVIPVPVPQRRRVFN
jgi:ankyrin repeat protein